MTEPLAVYLHDHFAGSHLAVGLLESMGKQHQGEPMGEFAGTLLSEIQQDQRVLQGLVQRVGSAPAEPIKRLAGGLMEKATRFKLHGSSAEGLGLLEKLEILSLGVLGKRCLWLALECVAPFDGRLQNTDYKKLITRAENQHQRLEEQRMAAVRAVFLKAAS